MKTHIHDSKGTRPPHTSGLSAGKKVGTGTSGLEAKGVGGYRSESHTRQGITKHSNTNNSDARHIPLAGLAAASGAYFAPSFVLARAACTHPLRLRNQIGQGALREGNGPPDMRPPRGVGLVVPNVVLALDLHRTAGHGQVDRRSGLSGQRRG